MWICINRKSTDNYRVWIVENLTTSDQQEKQQQQLELGDEESLSNRRSLTKIHISPQPKPMKPLG